MARFATDHAGRRRGAKCAAIGLLLLAAATSSRAVAAEAVEEESQVLTPPPPQQVHVPPQADDGQIANRLVQIFDATGWFPNVSVVVEEGVVFLRGSASSADRREWAGRVATRTEGVVAVVNQLELLERSMWDLSEAGSGIRTLGRAAVRQSPLVIVGLLMLGASWLVASLTSRGLRAGLRRRWRNQLLRNMIANTMGVMIFVLGVYLVLKVSGLTRLAVTVLGGTGLMGLVIGFAFRDIAENFLASLLMSMQRPFETGDLIEVAGVRGYVQQVNSRSTLLMTLDGNHVQIPNATVYKEKITNFWSNPKMRCEFFVGIGYDDIISRAQALGVEVMRAHPAVLADPEPSVLVDRLGSSAVSLRFWYWINVREFSEFKVKSAVIRLVKRAFQDAGISMPDEARELIFPRGVPVQIVRESERVPEAAPDGASDQATPEQPAVSDAAEGGLESDAESIERQAKHSRLPEGGRNLLARDG